MADTNKGIGITLPCFEPGKGDLANDLMDVPKKSTTDDKPTANAKTDDKPTLNARTIDNPSVKTKTNDNSTANEKTDGKPTYDARTSDKPTGNAKTDDKPTSDTKTDDKPTANDKTLDKPTDNTKTYGKPTANTKTDGKPTANAKTDGKTTTNTKTDNKTKAEADEFSKFFSKEGPDDSGPPEVTVVPRDEWSRIELPEQYLRYTEPVQYVLLTHTGTSSCSKSDECVRILRTLQRTHIALGYADIVYNFLIGGDGKVYEGRGWEWESAWIPKYTAEKDMGSCLKVAHIGYYGDYSKKKLEPKQAKLQFDFLETGMYKNYVKWNATMVPDYNEPDGVEEI